MEFKSEVQWDKGGKICKLTQLKNKEGKVYFMGDLGKTIKVTLHKIGGDYGTDKSGNPLWNLNFAPIKYTKIEEKAQDTADSLDGAGADEFGL